MKLIKTTKINLDTVVSDNATKYSEEMSLSSGYYIHVQPLSTKRLEIELLEYSGTQVVWIFGMIQLDPYVYDEYYKNVQIGITYKIPYNENVLYIRVYKADLLPMKIKVTYVQPYYFNLDNTVDLILYACNYRFYDIKDNYYLEQMNPGTVCVAKLLEHDGTGTVYIFGLIQSEPFIYDTFISNMQVGDSVKFVVKESYYAIRLYSTNGEDKMKFVLYNLYNKEQEEPATPEDTGLDNIDRLPRLPVDNPLKQIIREPGYGSIIHQWGAIGDSLSSGCTECHLKNTSEKLFYDIFEYSWPLRLFKLLGVDGYNFSYAGQQTKPWCLGWENITTTSIPPSTTTEPYERIWDGGNNRGAKYHPKQAYIIALGVNDISRNEFPLGSISDININDYTQNADSFAGYYAGIIQRVKSISDRCYVFCVTTLGNSAYDAVIRQIVELFDRTYLIDLGKYSVSYSGEFNSRYYLGGHMDAAGYQYTAYVMNTYIDYIIRTNWYDFRDAAIVNSDYYKM